MRFPRPLLAGVLLALFASVTSAEWSQTGGTLSTTSGGAGLTGQTVVPAAAAGGAMRLQEGFLAHRIFHRNAPFAIGDIEDMLMAVGGPSVWIPVSDLFAELDGDSLRYETAVQGTSVSAVVLRDSLVVWNRTGEAGLSSVSVIVEDRDGSASVSFDVLVMPSTAVSRRTPPPPRETRFDARVVRPTALAARDARTAFLGRRIATDPDDESRLEVELLVPGPSRLGVHIYDNLGVSVMSWTGEVTASDLATVAPGADARRPVVLSWNLRSSEGRPVSGGVYVWRIVATSSDGREMEIVRRLGVKSP